ncbi:hypothetical protein LTR95_014294 [Oleoguttula sp. CCFEE 5521]
MQRIILFLFAALAAIAFAAPTPRKHHSSHIGTFSAQARGRKGTTRNPLKAMERAYRKYNWSITFVTPSGQTFTLGTPDGDGSDASSAPAPAPAAPAPVSSAAATSSAINQDAATLTRTTTAAPAATTSSAAGASEQENGEVSATPESNESEYLSPVSVGGQTLNLDFDTGSADLWVFSTSLSSSSIGQHAAFDPSKSPTWEDYPGASWQIMYGDGSGASGTVGLDIVEVGGATASRQAVEIATKVSSSFVSDENNDGLLGLGFSKINTIKPQPQKTFFESILPKLDQPVFTADLEDDAAGTYEFGRVDTTKYTGTLHVTPVDSSNGFWEFASTAYSIGGTTYQNSGASTAIADTGTSLLLVDDNVAQAFYAQVQGSQLSRTAGGYVYPCSAQVPDFGVQIGSSGFIATIPGSDITFAEVGQGTCFGGVQGNGGGGIQIFGDVLLKQYFAVFNGGNESFGIAAKSPQVNTKA